MENSGEQEVVFSMVYRSISGQSLHAGMVRVYSGHFALRSVGTIEYELVHRLNISTACQDRDIVATTHVSHQEHARSLFGVPSVAVIEVVEYRSVGHGDVLEIVARGIQSRMVHPSTRLRPPA